ncbi:MAG: hypothetical protein AABX70_01420 [Nanoarchaeota archaeon]
MVNLNILLPDDLHQQLKLKAIRENKTLKELVVELLEKAVKNEKT